MPIAREFTITMEDRPGTLGKCCRALADRGVNILAFQSFNCQGTSHVRLVTDNPAATKTTLDNERVPYTEIEVAQVKLAHRPGELARAASRLGENNVNIDHAYAGVEPNTNAPVVFFGVSDTRKAATALEQLAAAAKS